MDPKRFRSLLASRSAVALLSGIDPAAACAIDQNGGSVAAITNSAAIDRQPVKEADFAANLSAVAAGVVSDDGIAREKLGPDTLWLHLKPLWPEDKTHLAISEVADWFAAYVYLPKLRDRVVLESAIRDAVAKLDPAFEYADGYDEKGSSYTGLVVAKSPPIMFAPSAVIVRTYIAFEHANKAGTPIGISPTGVRDSGGGTGSGPIDEPIAPQQPRRFYGSVEIDMVRPVKAFDTILNAVVMELQRDPNTKVKITLEIEAETSSGFSEGDIGVVRDNARQT